MQTNKKRWALPLLLSASLMPFLLRAQEIIYVDTFLGAFAPKLELGEINLASCSSITQGENGIFLHAFDLAVKPDSLAFLYVTENLTGYTHLVGVAVYTTGGGELYPNLPMEDSQIQGLTCDENGFAYTAGKGITKFDLDYPGYYEYYLGDLPPNMQCQGDITYRQGKFYLAAVGNKLVEVNMKNPANSKIVMDFPPGTLPIHGLTTVQLGCDSVATYAVGRATDHSEIYEIDFDNWTATLVCDMSELAITGAGSYSECMLPPCDLFIDLDHDNSSFAYWGNYCAEPFCTPPVSIADTDVVILSMANTLDSLLLVLSGTLDGALEYLETNIPSGNLTVLGNGSTNLLFINNGAATLSDFEVAIKSVTYQNGAPVLSSGMRKVQVTGWSNGVASIVSTTELPLSNDLLKITAIAAMPTCQGFQDGKLAVQPTSGTAPFSYQWETGDPDSLLAGIGVGSYSVTVTDAEGCVEEDTFALAEPDLLIADITNLGLPAICDSSGSLAASAIGGTMPYIFNWDNGVIGAVNNNLPAGDYLLTVLDSNGCEATANYTIAAGDTVLAQQAAAICQGESYVWNGLTLTTDTTLCTVFSKIDGCDSTICLSLAVNSLPQPQINLDGSLCNGGSVLLTIGGDFTSAQWSTGATEAEILASSPGVYLVTVTNGFGCTASTSASVSPGIEFNFTTTDPTCFGLNDGSITILEPASGTPPFVYSIDSVNFFQTGEFISQPPGVYFPSVMDATGCKAVQQVALSSSPPILLDAGPDVDIPLGETITLSAFTNLVNPIILWQPPDFLDCPVCLSTSAVPFHSVEYTVTVTDVNGCSAIDTVTVKVSGGDRFYVPTAFSPNGDGINDQFTILTDASITLVKSLRIFNRWGAMVFEKTNFLPNDSNLGWDGTLKGNPLLPGVYAFIAEIVRVDGKIETVSGEVTLLR